MCCKTSVNMLANIQESCFLMHYCVRKYGWNQRPRAVGKQKIQGKKFAKNLTVAPEGIS